MKPSAILEKPKTQICRYFQKGVRKRFCTAQVVRLRTISDSQVHEFCEHKRHRQCHIFVEITSRKEVSKKEQALGQLFCQIANTRSVWSDEGYEYAEE